MIQNITINQLVKIINQQTNTNSNTNVVYYVVESECTERIDATKSTNHTISFHNRVKFNKNIKNINEFFNVLTNFGFIRDYTHDILFLDFPNFDFSEWESLSKLFYRNEATALNLQNWNVSNCKYFSETFASSWIRSLNVSNWNVSNGREFMHCFENCRDLQRLDISSWNFDSATVLDYMFSQCQSLRELKLKTQTFPNVLLADSMFSKCWMLKNINLSSAIFPKLINCNCMFSHCPAMSEVDLSSMTFETCEHMSAMFEYSWKIKTIKFSESINTKKLIDVNKLFSGCHQLTEIINLDKFNFRSCVDFSGCFNECIALEKLNINLNTATSNLIYFNAMFNRCSNLSFDFLRGCVFNRVDLRFCFARTNITEEDLTNLKINGSVCVTNMLKGCDKIKHLDLSHWLISDQISSDDLF